MKSYRPFIFVVGTLLLLIATAAVISNRSSLAQESTPEATAPPEQTIEATSEVVPIVSPEAPLVATLPLLPVGTPANTPTPDALILTATAIGNPQNGGQISPPGQPLTSPSTNSDDFVPGEMSASFVPMAATTPVQVVYVINPNAVSQDSYLKPENALTQTSRYIDLHIATTWEAVRELDAVEPIEGIIIHESMYANADLEWTAAAARRGVVFGLLNLHQAELTELWNDACARQHPIHNPFKDMGGDYFYTSYLLILSDRLEDRAAAYQGEFDACYPNISPDLIASGGIQMFNDAHHNRIFPEDGPNGLAYVYDLIIMDIFNVRYFKIEFANPSLPATSVSPTMPPDLDIILTQLPSIDTP